MALFGTPYTYGQHQGSAQAPTAQDLALGPYQQLGSPLPQNPQPGRDQGLLGTSPTGVDNQAFSQLQNLAGAQNRRISMDEWLGVGGAPTEYWKLYGGTLNDGLYGSYANAAGAAGTQMTPQQYMEAGGKWEDYHRLYGTQALSAAPQFGTPYGYTTPTDAATSLQGQQQADYRNLSQQDQFNRVNEFGPYGSASYSIGPDGRVTRNYTLSPGQAAINTQIEDIDYGLGEAGKGLTGQVASAFGNPLSFDGLPQVVGADKLAEERRRIEDQVYDAFSRRNEPLYARQQEQFEQRMQERGIPLGSSLYGQLAQELMRNQNDARLDAQSRATQLGGTELQRSFDISGASRDRSIDELIQQRYAPAQELASIRGMQRGVMDPNYSQISNLSIPKLDVQGTGLGYSELANRLAIAKEAARAQVQAATLAANASKYGADKAASGGGGGDDFSFLLALAAQDPELDNDLKQAGFYR